MGLEFIGEVERWCRDMGDRYDMNTCCRCDGGNGDGMTDRCWLQEGNRVDGSDNDWAMQVGGDASDDDRDRRGGGDGDMMIDGARAWMVMEEDSDGSRLQIILGASKVAAGAATAVLTASLY